MNYPEIFKAHDFSGIKSGEGFKFDSDRFKCFSLDSLIAEKNGVQRPEFSGNMGDVSTDALFYDKANEISRPAYVVFREIFLCTGKMIVLTQF